MLPSFNLHSILKIFVGFSLNGELMMEAMGGETAFSDISVGEGLFFNIKNSTSV